MKQQVDSSLKLKIKFYNEFTTPFDVTPQDTLVEIRQFLQESSQLYFFTNFHFEFNGKQINEYQDVLSNGITDNAIIDVILDEYDERSARQHLRRVQDALNNLGTLQTVLSQKKGDRDEFPFNVNVQKKIFYEEENEQKNSLELADVIKPQIIPQFLLEQQVKQVTPKFLNALTFAGYNPPSKFRRLKGDFFYIYVKNIEGNEFFITASSIGFYVNKSTKQNFDSDQNNQYSINDSLISLFKELSPVFSKELQALIDSNVVYQQNVQLFSALKYNHRWLSIVEQQNLEQDFGKSEQWYLDQHGLDPSSIRDWNEELQVFRDLPKNDFVQKINRDKGLVRVHGDFIEASIRGAIAVVDKIIQPLNPMDPELQQVYVYNHIFFSFAMETPDSFRQETGSDATPTVSTTNCDFRNLKILHKLDIPNLHVLNATLIDYKGRRVIAQSIIPGILNSDHSNCTQYGSIDEGKTIQSNKEFHEMMIKVCEYFHLEDSIEFIDGQNQIHTIAGGIEVKGIQGSDKRKYLLDLLRLSPRDLNYNDEVLHQCCVLRPELIQSYYFRKALEKIKLQENPGEEAKSQMSRIQSSIQSLLSGNNDQYKLKLNAAFATTMKIKQNDKLEQQKQELKDVADFLISQAIPALAQDLKQPDMQRHSEPNSISEIFHLHGVNMRYLGKVAQSIDPNEYPSARLCLERTILCKSLKHVFRQALRETPQAYLADVLSHLLNCVFSRMDNKEFLQEGYSQFKNIVETEKKKKQKKKKSKPIQEVPEQQPQVSKSLINKIQPEFLKTTPQSIWDRVVTISIARYNYELPKAFSEYQWLKLNFFKLACLRELSLNVGIILACNNFQIEEGIKLPKEQLPFKPEDIYNVEPVVKTIDVVSDDFRVNLDLGQKFFIEGKTQEALECYLTAAQIIVNLFGTVHKDLANCFSKISAVYYKRMEYEAAIQFQRQSVSVNIHLYGFDSMITAASLTNLAFYHFGLKQHKQAFNYMLHALYLYSICGGDAHQEVFNQFTNLSLLYSETRQHQNSLNCLFEALDRCEGIQSLTQKIYQGKPSTSAILKSAGYNQAIALEHSELGDVQKAVEFQTKAVNMLKQAYDIGDYKVKESEKLLDSLHKALQEKKKNQIAPTNQSEPKRVFGTNRPQNKNNETQQEETHDEVDTEREMLLQRLKIAKMNARQGFRKNNQGIDLSRVLTKKD